MSAAAAAVGGCLPDAPASPRADDETRTARAGNDHDSTISGPWLLSKAALPRGRARLLVAAFLFVTSSTFTSAASSAITATDSVHCTGQARAVPSARLAKSDRGQRASCY
ncbi:unnamed protein product, partial [Laminaria digitata]